MDHKFHHQLAFLPPMVTWHSRPKRQAQQPERYVKDMPIVRTDNRDLKTWFGMFLNNG